MADVVIGIDPGKRGAWVQMDLKGKVLQLGVMKDIYLMLELLKGLKDKAAVHIFLEKAQAMPKNGAVSMFNYGLLFGQLEGLLMAYEYRYTLVQPRAWCKVMHEGARGNDGKEKSLFIGRSLFPNVSLIPDGCRVPHDGIVDALLIAEYGRRSLLGRTAKKM